MKKRKIHSFILVEEGKDKSIAKSKVKKKSTNQVISEVPISLMSRQEVVIEEISVSEVVAQDKQRFNSNNHWDNNKPPLDYKEVLATGEAKQWIDSFKVYKKISIDRKEFYWLEKAAELGKVTARFSHSFDDELEALLASHPTDYFTDPKGYFVRTNTVSLKCGYHGVGPYFDLKSVIESAVTCVHGHAPIYPGIQELDFYLMEWVPINENNEFRMFICNNRVTCISQQYTTKSNDLLSRLSSEGERHALASKWIHRLCTYWEDVISKVITHTSQYTIDIALLDDEEEKPFFIEINCFGKQYAAGSSLFHWLIDEDKLYGKDDHTVYFRYAI